MEKAEALQTIIASKNFFKKSIICGDITFEIIPYILHNHPIFPPIVHQNLTSPSSTNEGNSSKWLRI